MNRDSLAKGQLLLWYKIEDVLGAGGFGITYLAHDMNLDRKVAIKEYMPSDIATRRQTNEIIPHRQHVEVFESGRNRFIREARTMAKFEHPNIARVLNVFEAHETAYTAMRYERGQDLKQLLRPRKTLTEARILKIFLPVMDGLSLVHSAGFIHRDIKPGNIMICEDDTPVLIDFGSAHNTTTQSERVTTLVSPGYTPYEQYTCDARAQGAWTDIYSLAASMYRCVAGVGPVDALSRGNALLQQRDDPLVPIGKLARGEYSAGLLNGIAAGLRFKQADRPQRLDEWRAMLTGGSAPGKVRARRAKRSDEGCTRRMDKTKDSASKMIIVAGLAAAIISGAGLIVWSGFFSKDKPVASSVGQAEQITQQLAESVVGTVNAGRVGEVFADKLKMGGLGPTMVVLPAGDFIIGSAVTEQGRSSVEGPQQHVHITRPVAMGKTEITVQQFAQFVAASGYVTAAEGVGQDVNQDVNKGCRIYADGWRWSSSYNWRDPGFPQTGDHPVVCVSWNDAQAYIEWLSAETGHAYMLPSEALWEYAARAGATEARHWEADGSAACLFANVSDLMRAERHQLNTAADNIFPCNDGHVHTAPVGSFSANDFGLQDALGNVWEWTADCWNNSYETLPLDGSPHTGGACANRIYRGGSWGNFPRLIRAARRGTDPMTYRYFNLGFRVARAVSD